MDRRALPQHLSFAVVLVLTVVLGTLSACKPSSGYLRRWANTDGSEERFMGYLHDTSLRYSVRLTAFELLLEQWDYSMGALMSGRVLDPIESDEMRNALLRDGGVHLRELYDRGGALTYKMRDAAYHMARVSEDPAARGPYQAVLNDWFQVHWQPCVISGGALRAGQIMEAVGPENGVARVVGVLLSGTFEEVLCMARDMERVEWVRESEMVAQAYIARWQNGPISESEQLRFEFLEHTLSTVNVPVMREWVFARLADNRVPAFYKNAMLDAIAKNPVPEDLPRYTELLTVPTYTRWAAFQALVEAGGTRGLRHALNNLPANGEYGYYDGEIREDGFKRALENIVCEMPVVQELGPAGLREFERFLDGGNAAAELTAIVCLGKLGDERSLGRLRALRASLGRQVGAAPGFGPDETLAGQIDRATARIEARLGG